VITRSASEARSNLHRLLDETAESHKPRLDRPEANKRQTVLGRHRPALDGLDTALGAQKY